MKPILFTLFGVDLPAYFAMLATGFALATWLGSRWLGTLGYDREVVIDLGLAMVISGVLGARVLHVLADGYFWDYVHMCTDPAKVDWHITERHCRAAAVDGLWDSVRGVCHPKEPNCFAWAAFWAGGLTYYGGLLGAGAYAVYFLKRESFPFWKAADMAGFGVALGLAWGRMGCFLSGCCFGTVCHKPFAAYFPAWSPAAEAQYRAHLIVSEARLPLPVHPTQLYESVGSLAIALVAYCFVVPRKRFDGEVFVFFLGMYSLLRFTLEFWRNDDRGGLGSLSTSQWISLVIALLLVPLVVKLRRSAGFAAKAPPKV